MGENFSVGDRSVAPATSHTPFRPAQPDIADTDKTAQAKESQGSGNDRREEQKNESPALDPINYKSRYQLKMDSETGQIFTDIIDPVDDTLLGRIPSYFKSSEEVEAYGETSEKTRVTV